MNIRFKRVFTWSAEERKARLFRVMWTWGAFDNKLSFALVPILFRFACFHPYRTRIVVLGFSVHHQRSSGGRFA